MKVKKQRTGRLRSMSPYFLFLSTCIIAVGIAVDRSQVWTWVDTNL